MSPIVAKKLARIASLRPSEVEYNLEEKAAFLRDAAAVLKAVARDIGLPDSTYEVRLCKGGIAVAGEAVLHGETLYAEIRTSYTGDEFALMYRSCKGRKDFSGGQNQWLPLARLSADATACLSRLALFARLERP